MTNCCARLSRVYMITTNLLFACLGIAFIAFGLIGMQDKFMGATLFPGNTFKLLAILGAVICIASIFGIIGTYVKKNMITYVYMVIIIGALVFQVMIGIKIYQKAANSSQYLIDIWPKSSNSYRYNLQEQFDCCGFQTVIDKFAESDVCKDASNSMNVKYPCAPKLQNYVKDTFGKLYLVLFAALALELLAMSNAITLLCSGPITDDDEEDERRKRRKSGIRLDDMSVDTPTTVGSYQQEEQKNYYAGGPTTTATATTGNGTQNTYTNHEEPNRNNRYDSYDMYRHNNNSNSYSENYNGNTINNNRHGNGTAYY